MLIFGLSRYDIPVYMISIKFKASYRRTASAVGKTSNIRLLFNFDIAYDYGLKIVGV